MIVSVTELRNNFSNFLLLVQKGEEVTITRRSQVIALIKPPTNNKVMAQKKLRELRKKIQRENV